MLILFKATCPDWDETSLYDADYDCEAKLFDLNDPQTPVGVKEIGEELYDQFKCLWHKFANDEQFCYFPAELISTFWSGFRYLNLGGGLYLYEGAQYGFLQQNLLPQFSNVEIIAVKGSFGEYSSLEEYAGTKQRYLDAAEKVMREFPGEFYDLMPVAMALRQVGVNPKTHGQARTVVELDQDGIVIA